MMNKNVSLAFAALCILCGAGAVLTGCNKIDSSPTPDANTPAVTPPTVAPPTPAATENTTPTPIKDALTTLFAQDAAGKASIYPKGTHLLSVELKANTATVDVSKEFSQLQNKGDSYEGAAQKKLCAALAPFKEIETMRLTVEGKDYESQSADWRKVPVRGSDEFLHSSSTQTGSVQSPGSVDR